MCGEGCTTLSAYAQKESELSSGGGVEIGGQEDFAFYMYIKYIYVK